MKFQSIFENLRYQWRNLAKTHQTFIADFCEGQISNSLDAIEFERKEEELFFKSRNASNSIKQRVAVQVLVAPLRCTFYSYTVGEHLEIEILKNLETSAVTKWRKELAQTFSSMWEAKKSEFGGIISFVRKEKMRVILRNDALDKDDIPEKGLAELSWYTMRGRT